MMKKLLLAASLFAAAPAFAQNVQYVAPITRNHIPVWNTAGVLADGGSSADSPISSIGITNNGGSGLCINSARQSAGNYNALCFGSATAGAATISLQNFGTANPQVLNFVINGTTYPFPGALASITVNSTPVIGGTNGDCLSITAGIVSQVSCSILSAGTTGTGSVVLQNSPTLAGTIGGNLTLTGNELFTGNVSLGSQLIVNGVSTPPSVANQTVVMGTITAPTLANTGQGWVFNTAVGGLNLQGDGSSQDVTILNKSGTPVMQVPTGATGITFPGILTLSGLSSGTCANTVALDASNHTILASCPGAAASIQVGSTTVSSGSSANILFNNAGVLGNETIASILTAGTGIGITGTTNATIACNQATSAAFGCVEVDNVTILATAGVIGQKATVTSNSLVGDVALNNTSNYFDGPSTAQGTSGTFFAVGTVTLLDTAGNAAMFCKLWDGTTVIASGALNTQGASGVNAMALSGVLASPAANIRISCRDSTATTGKITFNTSGNSKDSTLTAYRIQ